MHPPPLRSPPRATHVLDTATKDHGICTRFLHLRWFLPHPSRGVFLRHRALAAGESLTGLMFTTAACDDHVFPAFNYLAQSTAGVPLVVEVHALVQANLIMAGGALRERRCRRAGTLALPCCLLAGRISADDNSTFVAQAVKGRPAAIVSEVLAACQPLIVAGLRPEDRRLVPIGTDADVTRVAGDFGKDVAAFAKVQHRLPLSGELHVPALSVSVQRWFSAAAAAYVAGAYLLRPANAGKAAQPPTPVSANELAPGAALWDNPLLRVVPLVLSASRAHAFKSATVAVLTRRNAVRAIGNRSVALSPLRSRAMLHSLLSAPPSCLLQDMSFLEDLREQLGGAEAGAGGGAKSTGDDGAASAAAATARSDAEQSRATLTRLHALRAKTREEHLAGGATA